MRDLSNISDYPLLNYSDHFKSFGVNNHSIDDIFINVKSLMRKEIEIIALKYEILSNYRKTGKTTKFTGYHKNDRVMEENIFIYKEAVNRVIDILEREEIDRKNKEEERKLEGWALIPHNINQFYEL